jgi:general secretion pathway protein D
MQPEAVRLRSAPKKNVFAMDGESPFTLDRSQSRRSPQSQVPGSSGQPRFSTFSLHPSFMIRFRPLPPLCQAVVAGSLLLGTAPFSHAQRNLQTTSEMEITRRQNMAVSAQDSLKRGDAEMIRQNYEQAMREYRTAVDSLPDAPATADRRQVAITKFFDATLKLANQRIIEGRYVDAETTAKVILRPEYDPGYEPALTLLKHLEDPQYYNQTITPKFIDKVQQVKDLLSQAQGYYDSARYELAFKRYEQVLTLDPTNIAARKGEERVDNARAHYAEASYDETRARLTQQVTQGWELPVHKYGLDIDPRKGVHTTRDDQGTAAINRKLQSIIIPNIEFRSTTISDAIEFLRQESQRLDNDPDPANRGINIFLKLPGVGAPVSRAAAAAPADTSIPGLPSDAGSGAGGPVASTGSAPTANTRISLTLSRIPLLEALRYVASQAGLKVKVEPYAVSIVPLTEQTDTLITAEFRVPPNFISNVTTGGGGGSALDQAAVAATGGGGGGNRDVTGAGSATISRQDAKTFLESSGVTFPAGASATYLAATSKLVVRNTQENVDLIESLVQENQTVIKQVEIESKFVEVTQDNLKELSFDVGLGQSTLFGNARLFMGGGTSGNQRTISSSDVGFVNPDGTNVGAQPITAGNRTGSFGITPDAIDALLSGGASAGAAPAIFSIAGVFSDPQFQIVSRALNQQKGVDLLSAPRVTTKSGQKATIEIIREFLYPTQFQPPQIPQSVAPTGGSLTGGGSSGASFPVTPTTPTNFEKRNTGVSLEVEPVIGPDNFTIDLNLEPQVVEFDGFINYGSPIQSTSTNALGIAQTNVLTANVINQPIFDVRKVSTSVSVYDGSTVVLGGLVREDVQKVNDKVPVLGDVPLIGRLFRSKIDQNIKRNLIIFVTAHLIDPSGQNIQNTEEEEETVQPLTGPDNYVTPTGPLPLFPSKK